MLCKSPLFAFKLLSTFLLCLWMSSSFAATLHAILVIEDDYKDSDLNNIATSIKVDYGNVSKLLKVLEERDIIKVKKTIVRGRTATLVKIKEAIAQTNVSNDDVLLFYFSGHGGMENGRPFLYTADSENLDRKTLEQTINAKAARLKIILTDACSNSIDGVVAMRSIANRRVAESGQFDEIYRQLFLKYKGTLSISAASEGEYAWSDNQLGGYFTHYLVYEGLLKKPVNSWEVLFNNSRNKTSQMYGLLPANQRAELKAEGIKGQTPKAYALPVITNVIDIPPTPPKPENNTNKGIIIENLTDKTVTFFRDIDPEDEEDEDPPIKLASHAKTSLPDGSVVYFQANKKDMYYYELEAGNYYFEFGDKKTLDLYSEDEQDLSDQPNAEENYAKLLTAKWEWDDGEDTYFSTLKADGNYTDTDESGAIITKGKWKLKQETENDETFDLLVFEYKEEGDSIKLTYILDFIDDDSVRLELIENLVNGEAENLEEEDDLSIMMYRH